ncbi:outer membrane beta-barrel domain-containing protein [Myxococcus landrumensis]|uniref:Outer membrane beta-barrel domain-containing protein n=1 Tax=Myxococcus landrumensis TaxID=2813577 RepID=A0ABX7N8Z2_9BACT|nr:outer membrane beta-barrel domain-containing protein [Myxococcus landrumus]QSQ15242.1 outer membrane beta-barrel domain-containing protein [Myxococcus landrumus]
MRPILSFALLVATAAQSAPRFPEPEWVLAQLEGSPSVPAPGAEMSVPPPPVQPEPKPERPRAPASRPEPAAPAEVPSVEPALAPMEDAAPVPEVVEMPGRAQEVDAPVTPDDAPLVASADETPRTTDAQQQELVNGAPLYNPNVSLHIVQKKRFADESKHEMALYPAVVQVNGKYTNHAGTALHYSYHLQENFALQVTGQYNWHTNESDFNLELIDKVREQAQAASSLLLVWGAQAGVEVTPLYGKFAFLDDKLAQFSLVLSGGAGVGSTRHLIRPEVANEVEGRRYTVPARFGDTGTKFLGSVGGGFRLQFGESYALRLEVRDLIYTARVDKVDGCNLADFEKLEAARTGGQDFGTLQLSSSCKYQKFDGVDPKTKKNYREDIILGRDLVAEPSSDVLNNISFYAGFSFLF